MRFLISLLSAVFASTLMTACSSGGGNSSSGGGAGDVAHSREEALGRLSPEIRKSFEQWQGVLLKSCDASEAFGLGEAHETQGIDGAVLLQANKGSAVFADADHLAVLVATNSLAGVGSSKVDWSESINGQVSHVSAETQRSGSHCVLNLFGQPVFEADIFESFVVGSNWVSGKAVKVKAAKADLHPIGVATGLSEITQHGVFNLLAQALQPDDSAVKLIASKLGLQDGPAKRLFKIGGARNSNVSVRILGEPSALWSDYYAAALVASSDKLSDVLVKKTLPLEIRLGLPSFSFGNVKNAADAGNLQLSTTVVIDNSGEAWSYSIEKLVPGALVPFDRNEALECAKARGLAYAGYAGGPAGWQVQPSVSSLFSPCRALDSNVEKASYESGLMKSLLSKVLFRVTASERVQYGGWDQVLTRLALEALEQGLDVRTALGGDSAIVNSAAANLETLKAEIDRSKNLGLLKDSIYRMGIDWALKGASIGSSRIAEILSAVDNTVNPFRRSAEQLLSNMGSQPTRDNPALAFAQTIDAAYKAEALKAQGLAHALGYRDFDTNVFDLVIQLRVSLDDLKDWSAKLSGVQTQISRYSNLGPVKNELVGYSIQWLKSGAVQLQDLDGIYAAMDNVVVPFGDSSKELLRDLAKSPQANQEALVFARGISAEYKTLALAIRNGASAAEYESWGRNFFSSILQKRPSLGQLRAWNEMWSAVLAFNQREKARTAGEFGSMNDWNRKQIIETAVKEIWSNAEFSGLESIAEVARAKNTCDHYKGASSLANCAGLRLFSKQKQMFFDPAWGGRYSALGSDFANYMAMFSGFDWVQMRWTLVGEFFGSFEPIWSKCEAGEFNTKASTLKSQVTALVQQGDQFKKWELERAIKETVSNCKNR